MQNCTIGSADISFAPEGAARKQSVASLLYLSLFVHPLTAEVRGCSTFAWPVPWTSQLMAVTHYSCQRLPGHASEQLSISTMKRHQTSANRLHLRECGCRPASAKRNLGFQRVGCPGGCMMAAEHSACKQCRDGFRQPRSTSFTEAIVLCKRHSEWSLYSNRTGVDSQFGCGCATQGAQNYGLLLRLSMLRLSMFASREGFKLRYPTASSTPLEKDT